MIKLLTRTGFRRGVLGGSQTWLVLGGIGLLFRLMKKFAGNEPEVVYSEELPVGSAIVIANEPR
jgi:hypothetical protein